MTPKQIAKKYRHGPSDSEWAFLGPAMAELQGPWGRKAGDDDNRIFLHALLWIAVANLPWRDLPPDFGKWRSVHNRYMTWSKTGRLAKLFKLVETDPDASLACVDSRLSTDLHA